MNADRFEKLTQGAWNITAMIGLAIGAAWTLATFSALGAREQALWQIEKLKAEEAELRDDLRRESAITLDLAATSTADPASGRLVIGIEVTITNKGTGAAVVPLPEDSPPLMISRLQFDDAGAPSGSEIYRGHLHTCGPKGPVLAGGVAVLANETRTWMTAVQVARPGLYLVAISIARPEAERALLLQQGLPPQFAAVWSASRLVSVQDGSALTRGTRH